MAIPTLLLFHNLFFKFYYCIRVDDLEHDDDGSVAFCFFNTYNSVKNTSIFDRRLSHLRAECLSSLTPIAIFKIDIDEASIVRCVSRDKCLRSILFIRVELKCIFSLA
jgi:hypothetical protein